MFIFTEELDRRRLETCKRFGGLFRSLQCFQSFCSPLSQVLGGLHGLLNFVLIGRIYTQLCWGHQWENHQTDCDCSQNLNYYSGPFVVMRKKKFLYLHFEVFLIFCRVVKSWKSWKKLWCSRQTWNCFQANYDRLTDTLSPPGSLNGTRTCLPGNSLWVFHSSINSNSISYQHKIFKHLSSAF